MFPLCIATSCGVWASTFDASVHRGPAPRRLLQTGMRVLTEPFPNKFSGTNFLLLIITCLAVFLSPEAHVVVLYKHSARRRWFWFVFFLSSCVVLSQALLNVKDKWRGNEATYLFFFSKRKEHWNIEAEELSGQGDSNTHLVRETIADWRFFPGSLLRNGKNKHQC